MNLAKTLFILKFGQPIEQLDYDRLALRGEAVEVLPICVSTEGVH